MKDISKLVRSRFLVTLTGESGFVMDNIRAADASDPVSVKIKELASKGSKMTAEEMQLKERLQWAHGLYQDEEGRLAYPGRNLWVAIGEAARSKSKGTAVIDRGGVLVKETDFVLGYEGPDGKDWTGRELGRDDLDALYKDPRHRLRIALNGNPTGGKRKSMIMRMRAVFEPWSMVATVVVAHDEVSEEDFMDIMEIAGRQGIGNPRKIGMGRFTAQVRDLEAAS